jgi:hypothetical protein
MLAYLSESQLRLEKREQAIQTAALRSAKANAKLLERQIADAKKQVSQLQAELRRILPVGRLIKWARQGTVSEQYFQNYLEASGYPDDKIALYWQEVIKDGPIPDKSTA